MIDITETIVCHGLTFGEVRALGRARGAPNVREVRGHQPGSLALRSVSVVIGPDGETITLTWGAVEQ